MEPAGRARPPALCPPVQEQTQRRERGTKQEDEQISLTDLKREQEDRERDQADQNEGRAKAGRHPGIKRAPCSGEGQGAAAAPLS